MPVFNFGAGPAMLPAEVLQVAADELREAGIAPTVMEISHRSERVAHLIADAEANLRTLLALPGEYRVLFLAGGATAQFAMLPLNLLGAGGRADYVDTGVWSRKAWQEARRYGQVRLAASGAGLDYTRIPDPAAWDLDPSASYVHVCTNETIGGLEFPFVPETGPVPLVADMSSHLLSRKLDVRPYGAIYASAQKNIGPAGMTLVIVREDLLDRASPLTPSVFHWRAQAEQHSLLSTPPVWAIHLAGCVFRWLLAQGGLEVIEQRNRAKAALLYDCIDRSRLYRNRVQPGQRSRMNVPFDLSEPALLEPFLSGAEAAGLLQLRGHRLAGGVRASIYNAMPLAGVQALVDYMEDFEQRRSD